MNFEDFNQDELFNILSRKKFYLKRKYRKKKLCKISCPIVMISNHPPNNSYVNFLHIVETEDSNI